MQEGLNSRQRYKFLNFYRKNPIRFLTDCLDVKPDHVWCKMEEIANSVRDHQFTAIKAGNSLSKSYTIGRLVNWFLFTHKPSTVVTTAPSNIQVEEILWREIRDSHANAKVKLGGKVLKTSLELSEKWFATGFATKPDTVTQQATRLQGFHNEHMAIFLDEAAGIDPAIWEAIDRLVTNPNVKLVVIGNPTTSQGNFVDCFKDPKFNKITVSVFDTPNYKEGREVIPGLAGRPFVEMVRNKFGEGTNQWKSMITGEIPDNDAESLIPYSSIETAFKREKVLPTPKDTKRFIVWDVADGGSDLHTIKCWENMKIIDSLNLYDKKIEEAEPYVWRMLRKNKANAIVWDDDGRGRVAGGYLEMACDSKTTLHPFSGSDRLVEDPETFYNVRDEAHWTMRDYFVEGKLALGNVEDDKNNMIEELSSCREDVESANGVKGRYIKVESKKKEKKRLGRSPDQRDNIMMACYADKYFDIEPIFTIDAYSTLDEVEYGFNPATC